MECLNMNRTAQIIILGSVLLIMCISSFVVYINYDQDNYYRMRHFMKNCQNDGMTMRECSLIYNYAIQEEKKTK